MWFKSVWIFCLFLASASLNPKNEGAINNAIQDPGKTLIVYLSRTENTRVVAELIQEAAGGTLVSLELQNPYPEDYGAIVRQVARENESGFLPPLKTKIVLSQYDTVFLGFPTWGMQLPPPVKTFLAKAEWEGQVVIPFNTNGGYGVGSSFEQVRDFCEGCRILEGFITPGGSERDGVYLAIRGQRRVQVRGEVTDWLKELSVGKP